MSIRFGSLGVFVAVALFVAGGGCSSSNSGSGFGGDGNGGFGSSNGGGQNGNGSGNGNGNGSSDGGGGLIGSFGDATTGGGSSPDGGCSNLQCQVQACPNGGSTTISGKVMDPAGHNPLYNVVTFIPNTQGGTLPLIPLGVNSSSCSCGALFEGEEPMADALTAADGTFTIKGAPVGKNIPLVVQIGKWRKEIIVPQVNPCTDNQVGNINLPKNHSDGMFASLPNIAVSTGSADTLECLLTRVGVDEAEFSGDPNTPSGRVHVFTGNGNSTQNPTSPPSSTSLWDSDADLERYDIVLLSCEGSPTTGYNSQTVSDYVTLGGRVFAEHYHYAFFANQSQFPNVATWTTGGTGKGGGGDQYPGAISGAVQTTLPNGSMFPEGQALETWLTNVGALTGGLLPIPVARHDATVATGNVSTPWVQSSGATPASTQYFTWDMPFNPPVSDAGVPEYCGRVVFSDLHVSGSNPGFGGGGGEDYTGTLGSTVPTGCDATAALQPDEDALEFILFDLSSCVTPVGFPPSKPPPQGGVQ